MQCRGDALQGRGVLAWVGEAQVLEVQGGRGRGQALWGLTLWPLRHCIEHLVDALQAGVATLEDAHEPAQAHQGPEQLGDEGHECDELADAELAALGHGAADDQEHVDAGAAGQTQHGQDGGADPGQADVGPHELQVLFFEAAKEGGLCREVLDGLHPLKQGEDAVAQGGELGLAESGQAVHREDTGLHEGQADDDGEQGQDGQLGVELEHLAAGHRQGQGHVEDLQPAKAHQGTHEGHVIADTGDDVAGLHL